MADAGTANSPTIGSSSARPARRRTPRTATSRDPRRGCGVRWQSRTARRIRPAGTSVSHTRQAMVGTPSSSGSGLGAHWSTFCSDEKIANKVVDVGCAEPGDQVVARARGVDRVSAEGHVAEGRQHCACGDPVQQGIDIADRTPAVGDQVLVHHRCQARPDRRRLRGAATDHLLLLEHDLHPGERVGDSGDVGRQPIARCPDRGHLAGRPRAAIRGGRTAPTPHRRCPGTAARRTRPVRPAIRRSHRWTGSCHRRRSSRAATRPNPARHRSGPAGTTSRVRLCIPGRRGLRWH